jgi:hypothetical protein
VRSESWCYVKRETADDKCEAARIAGVPEAFAKRVRASLKKKK